MKEAYVHASSVLYRMGSIYVRIWNSDTDVFKNNNPIYVGPTKGRGLGCDKE